MSNNGKSGTSGPQMPRDPKERDPAWLKVAFIAGPALTVAEAIVPGADKVLPLGNGDAVQFGAVLMIAYIGELLRRFWNERE